MYLSCNSSCRESNPCNYLSRKQLKPYSFKQVLRGLPKLCFWLGAWSGKDRFAFLDTPRAHHTEIRRCGELSLRKLVGSVELFGLDCSLITSAPFYLFVKSMISKWNSHNTNLPNTASLCIILWHLLKRQFTNHPFWRSAIQDSVFRLYCLIIGVILCAH